MIQKSNTINNDSCFGVFLSQLGLQSDYTINPDVASGIFFLLCALKFIFLVVQHKKIKWVMNICLAVFGGILMIKSGFAVYKLIGLIGILCSDGISGIIGSSVWIGYITRSIIPLFDTWNYNWYNWQAVLFISLSFVLYLNYAALKSKNEKVTKLYISQGYLNILMIIFYLAIYAGGIYLNIAHAEMGLWGDLIPLFDRTPLRLYIPKELDQVGILGFVFCLFWFLRERIYSYLEDKNIHPIDSLRDKLEERF